jgi:hypothetical protein
LIFFSSFLLAVWLTKRREKKERGEKITTNKLSDYIVAEGEM